MTNKQARAAAAALITTFLSLEGGREFYEFWSSLQNSESKVRSAFNAQISPFIDKVPSWTSAEKSTVKAFAAQLARWVHNKKATKERIFQTLVSEYYGEEEETTTSSKDQDGPDVIEEEKEKVDIDSFIEVFDDVTERLLLKKHSPEFVETMNSQLQEVVENIPSFEGISEEEEKALELLSSKLGEEESRKLKEKLEELSSSSGEVDFTLKIPGYILDEFFKYLQTTITSSAKSK